MLKRNLLILMIKINNLKYLVEFELDQYLINYLKLFIVFSLIYKRIGKYKIAYFYLLEANRMAD